MTTERRMPLGIQSFKEMREDGYVYVDKTDIVWRMAHGSKFNYFGRPRRFGKSLLLDTLRCYFEGRRELFQGLRLADMEKEWKVYPVIRFDMSLAGATAESVRAYFHRQFDKYERQYSLPNNNSTNLAVRFSDIVEAVSEQKQCGVVVLIDEYDSPLQHSWHTPDHEACTAVYREVFAVLKSDTEYERFVMITGITKFTQISLFSALNNLSNLSFAPECATLCGVTEAELVASFQPEIHAFAEKLGCTEDEMLSQLRKHYDGYHFSRRNMTGVYNPYCLINALAERDLSNYWIASGATKLLAKFVDDIDINIEKLDDCWLDRMTMEAFDVSCGSTELFLYQTGYLTIKGFEDEMYNLGFPNTEVRTALCKFVLPALAMRSGSGYESTQISLRRSLGRGDVSEAMKCVKALIADVPYSNKRLASMNMEERYRLIVSTILNAVGLRVQVERMLGTGRIDIVAWAQRFTYVFELKLSNAGGLAAAEKQIRQRMYAEPFQAEGKPVIALAVELDEEGKGLTKWSQIEAEATE